MGNKSTFLAALFLILTMLLVIGCEETEKAVEENSTNDIAIVEENVEPQMVLIEDAGQRLMEITKGHRNFSDVVDIKVYQQEDELLGTKTWTEVNTSYVKDWDDDGWCEEKAKLVILQAFTNDVIYLDEARVYNADGLQVASMRNWLPKE